MSILVLYDACALYPAPLRDLLIRLAIEGLCHARWSDEILRPHGIDACTADEFVLRAITADLQKVMAVVRQQAMDLKNPPCSFEELLEKLTACGLKRAVARLREIG